MTETNGLPTGEDLREGPRLLVGWRTRGGLEGAQIEVQEEGAAEVLEQICLGITDRLSEGDVSVRDYEPFGALEVDEIFKLSVAEQSDSDLESSSLVALVTSSHQLPDLPANELSEHHYTFYAIVWGRADEEQIAFVRKRSARVTLEAGRRFFRYSGTLTSIDAPDLVLDEHCDLVVRGDDLFILNEVGARQLLNDTNVTQGSIDANVTKLGEILGGEDRMTQISRDALVAVAKRKTSIAGRLAKCRAFFEGVTIDATRLRKAAESRFSDPDAIMSADGVICADESRIIDALDLIEGRLYEDEVTGEERKAERMSRRNR